MPEKHVRYVGSTRANIDYHDGQLRPAVGVQSYQVLRANREHPELADAYGWTYNHAPMLAYWRNRFYLEYLSNPVGEHMPPGQSLLTTSLDGQNWSRPRVAFPPYVITDGVSSNDLPYPVGPGLYAVMHQRMGFYVSPNDRLLVLGFYGVVPREGMSPQDGRGIGRVVREVHEDGTWGPIYFVRYNRHVGWNESNTHYPPFSAASDPGFVQACESLLADKLVTMQWWEEDRSPDGFYTVAGYEAPSYYHAADGRVVALWKWSHTSVSKDEGRTWAPVVREPSLVMAGAKVWGQRTSDGRYALVYNPSTHGHHRWPLAVVTSDDGYEFDQMLRVVGEIPPRRYAGNCKDYGAQYVRGIVEGNGTPPDGDMWIAYSMNKEDIWVSRIPVPVRYRVTDQVDETFDAMIPGGPVTDWNVCSGLWARVGVTRSPNGGNRLELWDQDPYSVATAERVFPEGSRVQLHAQVVAGQAQGGELHIEVADARGQVPARLWFGTDGHLWAADSCVYRDLGSFESGRIYDVRLLIDAVEQHWELQIPQSNSSHMLAFDASVASVERIAFRTGPARREPSPRTPRDPGVDLAGAGDPLEPTVFYLESLRAGPVGQ